MRSVIRFALLAVLSVAVAWAATAALCFIIFDFPIGGMLCGHNTALSFMLLWLITIVFIVVVRRSRTNPDDAA